MAAAGKSAMAETKFVDNDEEFAKLKKVVLECQPFHDGCATLVCVSCFRFLAFPSNAARIQCGNSNGVMSHVQARCVGCGNAMKIALGCKEVQCPKCRICFKPIAKMRVQVPEVVANKIAPPITIQITLAESIGYAQKLEFESRIIISKPLSVNIAGWEVQSGAKFHKVRVTMGDDPAGHPLDMSKTPVELSLVNGSHLCVAGSGDTGKKDDANPNAGASYSSCGHDFEACTFSSATNCAVCHEFIWGVMNQGKKCCRCNLPVHHRCIEDATSMCDAARRQLFGIMDFGGAGGESSSDDDEMGDPETDDADAVIAVPVEDPVAFLAALKEEVPPECNPETMSKLSQLGKFTDEEIGDLWLKYDKDNSGVLERGEAMSFLGDLVSAFRGSKVDPNLPENKELLEGLFRRLDSDAGGTVSWDEYYMFFTASRDQNFLQQFAGKKEFTTEDCYALWAKYDADQSGELDVEEVVLLLADISGQDPKALSAPAGKKHKLASFLKPGQKVSWDLFYTSFIPMIQAAVKNASKE